MFVKFGQIASTRTDLLPDAAHDRAVRPAVLGAAGAGRRRPRGDRSRARRHRRGGVRVVRLRAAGGRLDRPDPPGHAARRRAGRREGATPGHRGHRRPRRRGAAHGGQRARAARRGGPAARGEAAGRRAHRLARARARLQRPRPRTPSAFLEHVVARRWGSRRRSCYQALSHASGARDGGDRRRHRGRPRRGARRRACRPRVLARRLLQLVPRPGAARRDSTTPIPIPGTSSSIGTACCGSSTSERSGASTR